MDATEVKKAAGANLPGCLTLLRSRDEGLTTAEVESLHASVGYNEIGHDKVPSWLTQLMRAFVNPFTGILLLIILVFSVSSNVFFTKPAERDYKTVFVVFAIVLLSSLLRFFQEYASSTAAKKLKAMIKTNATVLRKDTGRHEADIKELVPGDIVYLSAGDMIPADCRVIHSKDLFISQSILTGESMPAEKNESPAADVEK